MSIDSVPDIAYDGEAKVETDPDVAVLTTSPASQSLYSPAILAFVPNHDKSLLQRLWLNGDGIKSTSTRALDYKVAKKVAMTLLHNDKQRSPLVDLHNPAAQLSSTQYPFIRKVETPLASTQTPDPQLVFQRLMQENHVVEHPNGISGLAFVLATVISLSLIRINEKKPECNETSPYLDLSPLYGVNDAETDMVRAKDGRGMLSPDCFYEDRVMLLPPAVSAFLILWNRNHNFIARLLLLNNEGNKWVKPSDDAFSPDGNLTANLQAQDDEIFTIARLINCVQFKNVVAVDFLKVLMGLPHDGKSADLDISIDHEQLERGRGHDSSMESALLYNWTSMIATEDVRKIEETVDDEFHTTLDQLSADDVQNMMMNGTRNPDRRYRDSAGLKRGRDGRFQDNDLARVLQDATGYHAGAPGARRIPSCFRTSEIMIIERARRWGVCSFNDFRKFLGLKVLKSFQEWNSNPDVFRAAEELYGSIDNLELYPGLQAEDTSGSGLGFGCTMTYGLFADIVAIMRSDHRFTTEFTAGKLTQWGYNDCTRRLNNGAFTSTLPRLLQRNFPRNYPYDNTYSLFPLTCPATTKTALADSRNQYDFERPEVHNVKVIETKRAISYVFNKPSVYQTIYGKNLEKLTDGYGYFLGFDNELLHDRDQMMTLFALIPDKGSLSRHASYFGTTAAALIRDKSIQNNGHRSVDIVRDVINTTCTRWVCEALCGRSLSDGEATKKHEEFAAIYAYIFRTIDPETGWAVREAAMDASSRLGKDIERHLPIPSDIGGTNWINDFRSCLIDLYSWFTRICQEMGPGKELTHRVALTFLDRMVKSNRQFRLGELTNHGHLRDIIDDSNVQSREEALEKRRIVANVLGLAVVTAVNYAQTCTHAVDFYLGDEHEEERKEIVRLSMLSPRDSRSQGANKKIMGYIREAQRLSQPLGLWRDVVEKDFIPQGNGVEVRKGDRIFADFNKAHKNAMDFCHPNKIDPDRKTPSIQGMGLHKCPGIGFVDETMPELFKSIFRLKNLRRDSGKAGRLEMFVCHPAPAQSDPKVYLDPTGEISHFPRSLSLLYDDDGSAEGSPSKLKKRKWRVLPGKKTEKLRRNMDQAIASLVVAISLLFILLQMFHVYSHHMPSFRFPFSSTPKRRDPPPSMGDIKVDVVECPTPTEVFQPYEIHTMLPGSDGHPVPLEYTIDHPKPHKLSVVDIDERDMQMAVYVDDDLRGLTRDFELNQTMNCGEDVATCLTSGFSAGVVVVRPGKHTVRIQWVGKDYIPGTHDIDWGNERSRRLKWQREYCA